MSKLTLLASILIFTSIFFLASPKGSITARAQGSPPSSLVISEFRFAGYFGPNDEYVELYNNSDVDIVVNAADGSSGWAVAEYGGYRLESSGNAVLPNGTVIKARSHFLIADYYQSSRSVVRLYDGPPWVNYGYFDGHQIPEDRGVAIFATNNPANFTDAYRLDSVGFSTISSGPYREGAGLPPVGATPGEYCFVRRASGLQLQDTNDNVADFQFVSTSGGTWNGLQSILGGPSPENTNSPRRGNLPGNAAPVVSLLDANAAANLQPNEVRDYQPVGNGTLGTLEIRRKITNTTGAVISKLRLRVTDVTGYPQMAGMADLRVLSSADKSVQLSDGTTATVKGTTVNQPPTQFMGGGLNSSISVALPGGSLANGASVNIRIVLGVMQAGNYRLETDIPLGNTQGVVLPGFSNPSIYGKVGNTSDGPSIGFSGVTITLSGSQSATTTTDANGNYSFNGLMAGGNYSLTPSKAGFSFAPVLQQVVNLSGSQEVDFDGGFNKPQPGDILISEFRNRGPAASNDEFIELYNNTDTDFTVSTDDESQGWTVVLNNGYNVILLPNGTVLKARQHFAGTQFYVVYSGVPSVINSYMGPRDTDWGYFDGFELPDNSGLALFKTNSPAHFTNSYRLDAVGFTTMGSSLYREGMGLAPLGAAQPEHSFVRRMAGFTAQDTNDNQTDFVLVTTDGGVYNGIQSVLGAPGPETKSSTIRANLPGVCGLTKSLLDSNAAADAGENFVNSGGTISIRRRITNGSGTNITRVRFRVVDISTLGNRGVGEADLRVISSTDTTATLSNGTPVTVKGTTLEQPPAQPNGGGLNSSLSVTLPSGGLAPGASVNVQFLLNVALSGTYRFDIDVPETPCDTTGPTTSATLTPGANAAGWNNSDVTVSLNATDNANGSGIKDLNYVASGGQSLPFTTANSASVGIPITSEGQTIITYFARDNASNTESPHTMVVRIDKTPPVIASLPSSVVEAAPGSNSATVTWDGPTASDNLDPSPQLSCSHVSGDSFSIGDTQVTCTATDVAGNSSTASFTVTVNPPADPVAPVTSAIPGPAANASGWNNSDVSVSLSAADNANGSGVKEIVYSAGGAQTVSSTTVSGESVSLTISAEGETTITYFARDNAGNAEAARALVIKIDRTPPVIVASRTPAAEASGWNREDVTATYTASDALSGLDSNSPSSDSFAFTAEGANQSHTFTVTDAAGNTTSVTLDHVSIDKSAPSLFCGSADLLWHALDVMIPCTATDNISSLANNNDASFSLVTGVANNLETANAATDSRTVCDVAGNCSTAGSIAGNKVDKKVPTINITSPHAGGDFVLNQTVTANYSCSDGGSLVSGCAGPVPNGSNVDTSSAGLKAFTVTATDSAGNTVTQTVNYTVHLPQLTVLGPAQMWLGLKNSDDVGTKFDLLAEVCQNGNVVGSGQLNDVPGGSSGFNNAVQRSINLALGSQLGVQPGSTLSLRLSVRIAASSGHRSGTARLWFNDSAANSRFDATIEGLTNNYFVRSGFALSNSAGPGPKSTIDVLVDRAVGGNPFKPFGTWSITF